ncbi:hypothetical protein ACP70R_040817 [Stipagrostis hirtigluma subsp. patula]
MAAAAADGKEDPRWRRSSTDCSVFLASRFACTKGGRCEYRHCEAARFNLRSCWYWFQGNCVNPSCTFRHPEPLESFNRTKSFADPLSSHASTSLKAASPCYFYYNSYCTKGDHCPFFHGPLDAVGICSEATTSNPTVTVKSAGVEMIESVKDFPPYPAEGSSDKIKQHHTKGISESSHPELDGDISSASETSVDTSGHVKSSTPSDRSSEHSAMEHIEQDEWRDSSPGFDVLVDDKPSNKNDLELQLPQETDANVLCVKYDGGDSIGYGPDYLDSEFCEQGFYSFDPSCYPVSSFYLDHPGGFEDHDSVTTWGHISHGRINLAKSSLEDPSNFISSMGDAGFDHQYTQTGRNSKRRRENRKGFKGKNNRIKRGHCLEPSIVSQEIESRSIRHRRYSFMGDCSLPADCATFKGQKKKSRRTQKHVGCAKLAGHAKANAESPDHRKDFSGPKTLAQIKEEKSRSKSNSHSNVHMPDGRSFSGDFEGPKSLNELLKAKGRTSFGN